MATHHFTLLVAMVTSTLPSTSSERNTVIHHVRTSKVKWCIAISYVLT